MDSKRAPPRPSLRGEFGEYYETLLMRLYRNDNRRQSLLPTVGITSCLHREGVSTVAANLAIHAAQALSDPVLLLEVAATSSSTKRNSGGEGPVGFGHFSLEARLVPGL